MTKRAEKAVQVCAASAAGRTAGSTNTRDRSEFIAMTKPFLVGLLMPRWVLSCAEAKYQTDRAPMAGARWRALGTPLMVVVDRRGLSSIHVNRPCMSTLSFFAEKVKHFVMAVDVADEVMRRTGAGERKRRCTKDRARFPDGGCGKRLR